MKKLTFRGGVHPQGGKELAADKAISPMESVSVMVYPLSQHIGAPAKACVAVGERVRMGQTIAQAVGSVSADIVSSVSGEVLAIEPRRTVSGRETEAIVIQNDGKDEPIASLGASRDPESLSSEEILSAIKAAGIVGLGGAGFPTAVKLAPPKPEEIDTLIINAAECEPYLTGDYRLLLERGDELIAGINCVLRLFPNAKAFIGIEDNKPQAIESLNSKLNGNPKISLALLHTKYPQGAERSLIYAITKRRLNSSMLPANAKCLVINTATAIAIHEAVEKSTPLMYKVITVTGEGANSPCNLRVRIGTSFSEVLDYAGGCKSDTVKIISGGPMMGVALSSLSVPVVKTSTSILCLSAEEAAEYTPTACIRCGRCARVCPEGLVPMRLVDLFENDKIEEFARLHGSECVECGSCSFICPAKRPLAPTMVKGKAAAKALAKK